VNNAFEYEVTSSSGGKRLSKRVSVGGVALWAIVFLLLRLTGHLVPTFPSWLWSLFK
jgi:hypothetical protein